MIFDVWPQLENETVILKKMTEADVPVLEQMLHDQEIYRYEPTYLPELLAENSRDFIVHDCDRLFREKSCILLGIYPKEMPEQFIGIAELYGYSARREKISIGYRLSKEYWHRGIATSVVSLLKEYILSDLRLKRITAHVRVENPASEKCLLNNGFIRRRAPHGEDWGFDTPVQANKYVIYPAELSQEELLFLSRDLEMIPLYHAFLLKLLGGYPETKIRVQKTQITFTNRHVFACISFLKVKRKAELPPHYLTLTLGLPDPVESERIAAKTEPYPGRWTTHIVLNDESQLDGELMGWLDLAYCFAERK